MNDLRSNGDSYKKANGKRSLAAVNGSKVNISRRMRIV
jgi:hypothetical protein